jgi:uncharacterized lipoprotein
MKTTLLLLTAALLMGLSSCSMLLQKPSQFGPPTQAQNEAHAQFTAHLTLP